jgi:lysophosphatidic acid acyltransferase/lysophosphatidylinositol acyltransferase
MYDVLVMFYMYGYFNQVIGFCLKKQIAYVPGIGWWCTRMKFPTLNRNISDLKTLESVESTFPIVIYPEGTRYSDQKYKESYQFAKQNDYPISKYAQLPKYKGAFALSKDIVYHMTLVYVDKNQRIITGEIKEFPHRVYIHVKKHTNVPREESEYKKWIQNQFANIDDIYDNFNPTNAIEMVPNMGLLDYVLYSTYCVVLVGVMVYLHSVSAIN